MALFPVSQIQDGGAAAILKNSNGDISTAHHPIYSVFGSKMGFSGSADRMTLFRVGANSVNVEENNARGVN